MRRKNLLEYILIAIFIMCMALALSAALEYVTRATEREYLNQGRWVIWVTLITLGLFCAIRVGNRFMLEPREPFPQIATGVVCLICFATGLVLRIWVIESIPIQPSSDFETYRALAAHLLNDTLTTPAGELYRRYVAEYPHTIGFPMLLLLPVFRVFGESVKAGLYANLVCSMLSVCVAGRIARDCAGRTAQVVAVAAMSLWPSHILYSNMLATEPLFTLLLLLSAWIMVVTLRQDEGSLYRRIPTLAVAALFVMGVLLALAGAVRPMAVILLAAYAVVRLMARYPDSGKRGLTASRFMLSRSWMCLIIVLVPYLFTSSVVANTITKVIGEKPVSGLSASGYNLMVGVNTASSGLWNQEDADFFSDAYARTGSADLAHQACMQVALSRVSVAPLDVLNLMVYKFRDLWQTDDFGVDWNLLWTEQQGLLTEELRGMLEGLRPVGRVAYMCLLFYALFGAVAEWRKRQRPEPMMMIAMVFFLGTALVHMLLETQVRYHYNMIPFLILMDAITISSWRARQAEDAAALRQALREAALESAARAAAAESGDFEDREDNTHFDLLRAAKEGHVRIAASEAYCPPEDKGAKDRGEKDRGDKGRG